MLVQEGLVIDAKPFTEGNPQQQSDAIMQYREELLALRFKKYSYLVDVFIPELLDLLERNIGDKRPDTSGFTSVNMELSSEGKARWKETIDNNIEFVPFRGFEQLVPFMNTLQIERLDAILTATKFVEIAVPTDVNDELNKHEVINQNEVNSTLVMEEKNNVIQFSEIGDPLTHLIPQENTHIKETPETLDFLLLLCRFLDEISPLAFFIPIIGQVYLGARLVNNLEPLTIGHYSFFSCISQPDEENELVLEWNYAPSC